MKEEIQEEFLKDAIEKGFQLLKQEKGYLQKDVVKRMTDLGYPITQSVFSRMLNFRYKHRYGLRMLHIAAKGIREITIRELSMDYIKDNKSYQKIQIHHKLPENDLRTLSSGNVRYYSYNAVYQFISNPFKLMQFAKKGLEFQQFSEIAEGSPFSIKEWSKLVQLNERTLQRYKQENTTLGPIYAERVLGILQVLKQGELVFGSLESFKIWLDSENIVLGGVKPKSLLDSTFGIEIVKNELIRIEHGILA